MEMSTALLLDPSVTQTDNLARLKAKARTELNAALRRRNLPEIIEWANPRECERKSATMCLLGCTVGLRSTYISENPGSISCHPGSDAKIKITAPDGIDDIIFYPESPVAVLTKMFDSGVLEVLEAI